MRFVEIRVWRYKSAKGQPADVAMLIFRCFFLYGNSSEKTNDPAVVAMLIFRCFFLYRNSSEKTNDPADVAMLIFR